MHDPADPEASPFDRVVGPWQRVIDDMHATADQHREYGRQAVTCHPGDVATLTPSGDGADHRLGLDVVLPGDEFETVRSVLSDRDPGAVDVFAATDNGLVFLLLSLSCGDVVVLVPAYYDSQDRDALEALARERGLPIHLRPLADDERVTVTVDDPDPCFH